MGRGTLALQHPWGLISYPSIASATVLGCGMHQAALCGSSQVSLALDVRRVEGPPSCAPTSEQAPMANAHPARTRRTRTGVQESWLRWDTP